MPSVTLAEATLAMRDVVHALSALSPVVTARGLNVGAGQVIVDFVRALNPDQQQLFYDEGLDYTALSPAQQGLVRRIALHLYAGIPKEESVPVLDRLLRAPQTSFTRQPESGGAVVLGYESLADNQQKEFRALKPQAGTDLSGSDNPFPDRRIMPPVPETTLGDVVDALQSRSKDKIAVDEALRAKAVTVIGGDFTSPSNLLETLAEIYGLRVKTNADGSLLLTRRLWRAAPRPEALPATLAYIMPAPLLRAAHFGAMTALERQQKPEPAGTDSGYAEWMRQNNQYGQERRALRMRCILLLREAIRQLNATVNPPLIKQGPDTRLPVIRATEQQQEAFVVVLTADFLHTIFSDFQSAPPLYITQMDRIHLSGGKEKGTDGREKISCGIGVLDPTTNRVEPEAGVGNIDYSGV